MVQDSRNTRNPENGVIKISSDDSGPFKALSMSDGETLSPNTVIVHYSNDATAEVVLDMYDEEDETAETLEGFMLSLILSPGDKFEVSEAMFSDISDGVVVDTGDNHDGTLTVNIGGGRVT